MRNTVLENHLGETIESVLQELESSRSVLCVRPTGYGKTRIMSRICQIKEGNKVIVVPQSTLIDYMDGFFEDNSNVSVYTYQKLITFDKASDIRNCFSNVDMIFLDEAHRVAAEKWSKGVELLLEAYPQSKVVGLTATPIRTDGKDILTTSFETQIEPLTLVDSIEKGFLKAPYYVSALYTVDYEVKTREKTIKNSKRISDEDKKVLLDRLNKVKFDVQKLSNISTIFSKHLNSKGYSNENMKFIVFCPNISSMKNIVTEVSKWFQDAFEDKEINVFQAHSEMTDIELKKNIDNFKEKRTEYSIDLIFSVNMFNEGVHIEGLTGAVMLRKTHSHIVYFQQIGRVISTSNEKSPIIFDLVNAYRTVKTGYVSELERKVNLEGGLCNSSDYLKEALIKVYDEIKDSIDMLDSITDQIKNNKEWSKEEDDIILKYYPIGGYPEVQRQGVNRTKNSIFRRAGLLGVSESVSNWTDNEIKVLMNNYEKLGTEGVQNKGVNKTKNAIVRKASSLGLKMLNRWTEEEDQILVNHYKTKGINELEVLLPKRTQSSIESRALFLGLVKSNKWTEEEDELLKESSLKVDNINDLHELIPNRTIVSLRRRLRILGIRLKGWTEEEDELIRKYYPTGGVKEVHKILTNRTTSAISSRAGVLKVKRKYK